MPRIKHTVDQIITRLREAEVALSNGQPAVQVCRTLGVGYDGQNLKSSNRFVNNTIKNVKIFDLPGSNR